jgi:hypothetical protein
VYNTDLQLKDIMYFWQDAYFAVVASLKRWECWPVPATVTTEDLGLLQRAEGWFLVE